jgi:hypothetical protein
MQHQPPAGKPLTAEQRQQLEAIHQGHANNFISGNDVGAEALAELLALASEPISDEEFTRRAPVSIKRVFCINIDTGELQFLRKHIRDYINLP